MELEQQNTTASVSSGLAEPDDLLADSDSPIDVWFESLSPEQAQAYLAAVRRQRWEQEAIASYAP